jgi:hypothetical protein
MGIRFLCANCGHKLNVKSFLAGKRGVCPQCGGGLDIPYESQISKQASAAEAVVAVPGGNALPISQPSSSGRESFVPDRADRPERIAEPFREAEDQEAPFAKGGRSGCYFVRRRHRWPNQVPLLSRCSPPNLHRLRRRQVLSFRPSNLHWQNLLRRIQLPKPRTRSGTFDRPRVVSMVQRVAKSCGSGWARDA